MKLRELFARIGPMFFGRASAGETARALYGDAATGTDGRRIALYDHVGGIRAAELAAVFARTAEAAGAAWFPLARDYFVAHPWGRFDRAPDGGALADFIARESAPRGLPAWLAALAALEWAMYVAGRAPAELDRGAGPLRVPASLVIHEPSHDLAGWLLAPARSAAPAARRSAIAICQAPSGAGRFMPIDDVQRAILDMLRAGALDPDQVPASPEVTGAAVRNLARFGLVLGDVAALPVELDDAGAAESPALGRDLARRIALAPGAQVCLEGDAPAASPDATDVVVTDDADAVAVAQTLATPRTVAAVIAAHADRMTPAAVVTILDGLADAGLVVPADADADAVTSTGGT